MITWAIRRGLVAVLLISLIATVSQTASVVTVDSNQVLVINGRKVFPIGFSPGPPHHGRTPTGEDALKELRSAGALLIRPVMTTSWNAQVISNQAAFLDWAAEQGMFCWV